MYEPTQETFAADYGNGRASLVWTRLVADLETPVSAFLKLSAGRDGNVFLLESVEGGATRGRYSMIGLDPDVIWRAQGDASEINRRALAVIAASTRSRSAAVMVTSAASCGFWAKLRFSLGTLNPPLRAMARCFSGSIEANPRVEVAMSLSCPAEV